MTPVRLQKWILSYKPFQQIFSHIKVSDKLSKMGHCQVVRIGSIIFSPLTLSTNFKVIIIIVSSANLVCLISNKNQEQVP